MCHAKDKEKDSKWDKTQNSATCLTACMADPFTLVTSFFFSSFPQNQPQRFSITRRKTPQQVQRIKKQKSCSKIPPKITLA